MTDRDTKGRFAKGWRGGPGRPKRATEEVYLATIAQLCPPNIWAEIVARAVQDALRGDHQARQWLSQYLIGRPVSDAPRLSVATADPDDEAAIVEAAVASMLRDGL